LAIRYDDDGDDDDNNSLIIDSFKNGLGCNSSTSSKSKSARFESDEVNIRFNIFLLFFLFARKSEREKGEEEKTREVNDKKIYKDEKKKKI